ncbi:MAG: hypothetical protein ACOCUL_04945 [Bacteroidota bacterium]
MKKPNLKRVEKYYPVSRDPIYYKELYEYLLKPSPSEPISLEGKLYSYYPEIVKDFQEYIKKYDLDQFIDELFFFTVQYGLDYHNIKQNEESNIRNNMKQFKESYESLHNIIKNNSIDSIKILYKSKEYELNHEIILNDFLKFIFEKYPTYKQINENISLLPAYKIRRIDSYFKWYAKKLKPFFDFIWNETQYNEKNKYTKKQIYNTLIRDFGNLFKIPWEKYTTDLEVYLETSFKPSKH